MFDLDNDDDDDEFDREYNLNKRRSSLMESLKNAKMNKPSEKII